MSVLSVKFWTQRRALLAALLCAQLIAGVVTVAAVSPSAGGATDDDHTDAVTVGFEHHSSREFDLVLGADGLHSRVRELVFGGPDPEHYLGCVVAAFTVAGYRPRDELTYVLYNVPGAHAGRFTLRDDRTLFILGREGA